MKLISPKLHAVIDYLVVLLLFVSPTLFPLSPMVAMFTYILGCVHLALTLLTQFPGGVIRVIPLHIHGFIELFVGLGLLSVSNFYPGLTSVDKLFYTLFASAVLVVWLTTDYRHSTVPVSVPRS